MIEFWQIGQELVGPAPITVMAEDIPIVVSTEDRPHVVFDEEAEEVRQVVLPPHPGPFLLAHEFGHAWHCHQWPRLTWQHQERGEAAALFSEGALVTRRLDLWPFWSERVEILHAWRHGPEAGRAAYLLGVAHRAGRARGSYRSVVRRIMEGKFDG